MKLMIKRMPKKEEVKGIKKVEKAVGRKLRTGLSRRWKRRMRRRLCRVGMKLSELALVAGAAWVLYDQRNVLLDKIKTKLPFKKA